MVTTTAHSILIQIHFAWYKGTQKHDLSLIPAEIPAADPVINGYVGQVIYLVNEIRQEMGCPDAKVIATGGMARLIAQKSGVIDHIDGLLTLKGLRLIYEKNQAKA